MKIIQRVQVFQVLTENSKNALKEQFLSRKRQLEKECGQLQFEMKKMEKTKKFAVSDVRFYFEREIKSREEKIKWLEYQLEQLEQLPIGSEIKDGELEAVAEIGVGDSWDKIVNGKSIVVKDGIIVEIREG
ncbi:MAG: hypothetical protein C6P37_05960 [Caldibacillus debilis]|jgi:hypothetical protein|uniref:YlqD protein n=2 Tax=Caldibacillus debilis TaxID=301148 RepID=A0A420VBK6_9BACI|nr:YlqD family protein [Caldibacillus debilis]OUM91707.1 MAG: hypothetical protein BAA03_05280 [Caldibacillus debilis]REJ25539.1 MAG: hypothetical protein C6W56_13505 [Caldibacillus debilis]REJ29483.1 MAG: hypothetical protein C6P37_05960 [Caldibacillus debilis]RKO60979.1 Protein of unknown function (DUF2869) [Caldibacillus debilis GB1]